MFDDDIWDEEQWEAFLKKEDERVSRYMKLLNRFLAEFPLPKSDDPRENQGWKDAFKAYLIQHGLPLDDLEPSVFLSDAGEGDEEGTATFDLPEDELTREEDQDTFDALQQIPQYRKAYALTMHVLSWSDNLPGSIKDSALVQYCSSIMQITANIAKGHGMGYEREVLGGNIACLKRGIQAANTALDLLSEMKSRPYLTPKEYKDLYENTYEMRNEVGLYIQELRDRFNLGID